MAHLLILSEKSEYLAIIPEHSDMTEGTGTKLECLAKKQKMLCYLQKHKNAHPGELENNSLAHSTRLFARSICVAMLVTEKLNFPGKRLPQRSVVLLFLFSSLFSVEHTPMGVIALCLPFCACFIFFNAVIGSQPFPGTSLQDTFRH